MEREVWMRGPIPSIPTLLQPVAHALLQVKEDIQSLINTDLNPLLWERPYGLASIAFHLQHIAGVTDRMFTYANGQGLSEEQFDYLHAEGKKNDLLSTDLLKLKLEDTINQAIKALENISPDSLTEVRYLGRQKIPTTQIGLLFHAAEHAQRHFGQLLVTVRMLQCTNVNTK